MNKRLLAVFAHPDDEAFGPGGTLAKYAHEDVEIDLVCATRGEAGGDGKIREKELLESARILGIKKVEFLDFVDGTLCNAIYHDLAKKIMRKINSFKPQVIMTIERRGVSGHLDHIAVSMITTYSYIHTNVAKKLYYYCLTKEARESEGRLDDYFVYFPEGYPDAEITTKINIEKYWDQKVEAMKAHKSQIKDVNFILSRYRRLPKVDSFILQYHRGVKVKFPETDLFAGL
ncbi:hypothetical protein A2773_07090 [Candidatus Gottesmanbacteria bacterium RIFCSPHIGHO2_01_FULL_39_10]|uniref:GlcNAc-PI de-N-acetylase n=1 Tax=Candidatus Gottesmanbacteria bacterium RIFCSPHIGHO2_01_FULL_39_10 TaxID=1798375 RepID=A0A1F5ZQQ4_9BACT|nr:MAG: hypothetical protein A2773_07090 [Candidatus Gottesmanbacteria bacterium RIFCSPHIGHO2_01_FULL_39_10]